MREKKTRVHVITLGCAKNIVDSEKLMAQLQLSSIEVTPTLEAADIAVINTCGFIDAAKEESINTIIGQVKRKAKGRLRKVYVMGCLAERYRADLTREIPEVDRFFGTGEMPAIVEELGGRFRRELLGERLLTTPSHSVYLKISEGCDNPCSFCAIPLMRGGHVSRPLEEVVAEAKSLTALGAREIVVIGQDTTYYGLDLYGHRRLPALLEALAEESGADWIRLMYAYPAHFPLEVLAVMARHPEICKYLDLPVQHASDAVLRSMRRGISRRALLELVSRIRDAVPGIAIRTTLIVGYPEEGEREFAELEEFIRDARFARLGVFTYSQEEGTTAHPLGDPVSAQEKERRKAAIMEIQQEISRERNESLIGTVETVLIDRIEDDMAVGRTSSDAPEIDNEVYVRGNAQPGSMQAVTIDDATEYDLYGSILPSDMKEHT